MKIYNKHFFLLLQLGMILGFLLLCHPEVMAQDKSIVKVNGDKSAGYGVAYGGTQNLPDRIVTALHIVAGKKSIIVNWNGTEVSATIEKIYKPSDLALLKLSKPLNIPMLKLYSGEPPTGTNINYWVIPPATATTAAPAPIRNITKLQPDNRSSLENLSDAFKGEPVGISMALCMDEGKHYPATSTMVINFSEAGILKKYSGTPLTYGDKIVGMVDGGVKPVNAKPCVWAIPASDFNKLFTQGTPPSSTLASCDSPTNENKYMYSGMSSDNPNLNPEEVIQAQEMEQGIDISAFDSTPLTLFHNYTMSYNEVYESLFKELKSNSYLGSLSIPDDSSITLDDLMSLPVSNYVESNTGASVLVPAQCKITPSSDAFGSFNIATSPGGLVTMAIYIIPGDSIKDAANAEIAFKAYQQKKGLSWEGLTVGSKFAPRFREKTQYYSPDSIKAMHLASFMTNEGDFLAVITSASDWKQVAQNPEEKLYFYFMENCALLSGFTVY